MIGFLTTEYPGLSSHYGGIGTSIRDLVQGLIKRSFVPYVFLINDHEDRIQTFDGALVIKIKRRILPGLTAYLTGAKVSNVVNDFVRQGKIVVLEVPDWTGLTAFVNVDCPTVMRLNGSETYFKHLEGKSPKFRYWYLERRAFLKAKHLISVSRYTSYITNKIFHTSRVMEIIPNTIDSDGFAPDMNVLEKQTVLYFGTLARKKGVLELPSIFEQIHARHPDATFLIIGRDNPDTLTGSKSTWTLMQQQLDSIGEMNVQFIPGLPRHELLKHIQQAAVCVFPSFAEALPVSWLEAMSCGKAIVASNIGWASEIVTDSQNGFLVHPTDHKLFADKVICLLSDADLRNRMGMAARHTILDRFSSKVVLNQYLMFYTKILGKSIDA